MNHAATSVRPANAAGDLPQFRELLAFRLGNAEYAIDILSVQELRRYEAVTAIPGAPSCVMGVTNLRGAIVPIVDLRRKLGIDSTGFDGFTVAIIVNVAGRVLGLVVDGVSDVLALPLADVRPAPELGGAGAGCIAGLGMIDDRMLVLLDLDRLVADDTSDVAATAH